MADIPVSVLTGSESERLARLQPALERLIVGQEAAIDTVCQAIFRARAGLTRQGRPEGSFLFCGPTGVGKTELARQIAQLLGLRLTRLDMSEYMETHTVSRLVGSPPGYVDHDEGGQLTEALRRAAPATADPGKPGTAPVPRNPVRRAGARRGRARPATLPDRKSVV